MAEKFEFKKLSETETAETVGDSATVLVEDGGVIKRTPKAQIGTVKTVNGVEPDETGDVKIAIDGDDVITQTKLEAALTEWEAESNTAVTFIEAYQQSNKGKARLEVSVSDIYNKYKNGEHVLIRLHLYDDVTINNVILRPGHEWTTFEEEIYFHGYMSTYEMDNLYHTTYFSLAVWGSGQDKHEVALSSYETIEHSKPSSVYNIDYKGNAWYKGTVEGTAMIVNSSTSGSTKRFKITVDDSGTISATELTT
jgi:hypothetical protein